MNESYGNDFFEFYRRQHLLFEVKREGFAQTMHLHQQLEKFSLIILSITFSELQVAKIQSLRSPTRKWGTIASVDFD